ncbi:unnamed protein product [Leuciscus chuanchicus]
MHRIHLRILRKSVNGEVTSAWDSVWKQVEVQLRFGLCLLTSLQPPGPPWW